MKRKKWIKVLSLLFSVMLLCVGVVGCEQSENIDENIKYFTLPDVVVGETFELEVEAIYGVYNIRSCVIDIEAMEYVSGKFVPPNNDPNIIGGGTFVYTFKPYCLGEYKIKISWHHVMAGVEEYNDNLEYNTPYKTNIYTVKFVRLPDVQGE